jgi:hypothetical protein
MLSPFLPIYLSVLATTLPLIVSAECTYWGQEACDWTRSSSIRVVTKATTPTVIFHRLGNHAMRIRGVWPTLPSVAPNGKVVIAACANNLLIFDPPELTTGALDPNTIITDGLYSSYMNVDNFAPSTDISIGGVAIAPSSTAVITEDNKIFWVNREQSMLYSYDLMRTVNALPRINISDRTTMKNGFWTYKAEFPLLYYNGYIHMPDPNHHAALRIKVIDGTSTYADSTDLSLEGHRLQGSCGSTGGTLDGGDKSVVFLDYGTGGTSGDLYGAYSIDSDGKSELWRSNVEFDSANQEFSHPVHLDFSDITAGLQCDIALVWETAGVRISGMNSKTGKACGKWESNEPNGDFGTYIITDLNTENANWVSGPAVIKDEDYNGYWLYANVNLVRATNQSQVCSLLQVFVSNEGVLYQTGQFYTRRLRYTNCNAAPLAMLDLFGPGQHGIAVLMSNGTLAYFLHNSEGQATLKTSFSLFPYLPDGNLPINDRPLFDFAGNYMAATTSASLLFVVHERNYPNPNAAYLVAVVNGHLGTPLVPGSSSGSAASASASNTVSIPGAVFGTISSLIAVAALIVYFAPTSAPAKTIFWINDSVNNVLGIQKIVKSSSGNESTSLLKSSANVSAYTSSL